ncbi:hypothetical protein [Bradyrhizobium ottawaense]|uniref:hypothetical protein n=1 Tax=Bradyrhizobium ottawaense TaxID=931866 RepID=UPI003392C628
MISHAARAQADVEIRRLNVDDLDLFRDIRAEALQMHPQTFGSPEEDEGGEPMMAAYRRWLDGMILGAFRCGSLMGVAGFYVSARSAIAAQGQHLHGLREGGGPR